ncbi:type II toxin-antitoxin system VapC family toxin [Ferrovum sp.]|uniref:type II toxin-antitoxin system VapC family toxin n=1 Tax=Ferrovum sp. TaxID=2609467 RepID=UPI00261097B7|nr:type II toxin-antitoxin system VapC family toxin [Ferrovum sp.]
MGKIEDAIARMVGHRVYLDTNVFVYFLDRNPDYFSVVAPVIEAIDSGLIIGYTGDAVIAETLVRPYQTGNPALVERFKAFFSTEDFLSIQPHDAEAFDLAAQLRAERGLKFIDALHYATAILAGCKFFLTNDGAIQSSDVLEVISVKILAE